MKILVAVPCLNMVDTDFAFSLACMQHDGVAFAYSKSSLVYDGRNKLANNAIDGNFDRVLWLDSDMKFSPDTLHKFNADLDKGMEIVCGIYTTRTPPITPAIYSDLGYTLTDDGKAIPQREIMFDYPQETFEVAGCGFAGVMMEVSVLKKVRDKYGLPFSPVLGFGEDLSFCLRAGELGYKIYCDPSIKLGHIGYHVFTEADIERHGN